MAKLDRLVWADGVCFESYGLRIGIRFSKSDPELRDQVIARLPPGWKAAEGPFVNYLISFRVGGRSAPNVRNFHLLHGGLRQIARTMNVDEAIDALEKDVQLFIAEWAHDRLFVHAGVIGFHDRAILIPGRSFSGKSTLVTALLEAGATYFSDEYAVLDSEGLVHPFPRHIALREGVGVTRRINPRQLAPVGEGPLPVRLIVLSRYQAGAQWNPRTISPGIAMLELLSNAIPAASRPDHCLTALKAIVPHAKILKGIRGEAHNIAHDLLESITCDGPVVAPNFWARKGVENSEEILECLEP